MAALCAIDFETSGYDAWMACAVGLTRIEDGRTGESRYTLLRPPSRMVLFTEIHGLTWKMLQDAPTFAEVWPGIASFLDGVDGLIAHNAPFDRRVLAGCLSYNHISFRTVPFLCTLRGVRAALDLPSNTLSVVCRHLSIPLQHHHAGSDARACAEIYLRLHEMGVPDETMLLKPK